MSEWKIGDKLVYVRKMSGKDIEFFIRFTKIYEVIEIEDGYICVNDENDNLNGFLISDTIHAKVVEIE